MRRLLIGWLLVLTACGAPATTAATTASVSTAVTPAAPASTGGTPAQQLSGELNVSAAASLTEAFKEIGTNFERANAETHVVFNFAGSQQLAQQIAQGAPVDVFASANATQMNAVIKSGQVVSGTQQTFVRNRLTIVVPKDNPGDITSVQDLAKPSLKLVFAARSVPVGAYTLEFLSRASKLPTYSAAYSPTVLANVVSYEDNVRAVLSKVALGEADGGVVYTSDITPDAASKVTAINIPDELNVIASYPIAPIQGSAHAALADAFIAYVRSSEGQQILAKYGFIPAR